LAVRIPEEIGLQSVLRRAPELATMTKDPREQRDGDKSRDEHGGKAPDDVMLPH